MWTWVPIIRPMSWIIGHTEKPQESVQALLWNTQSTEQCWQPQVDPRLNLCTLGSSSCATISFAIRTYLLHEHAFYFITTFIPSYLHTFSVASPGAWPSKIRYLPHWQGGWPLVALGGGFGRPPPPECPKQNRT